MLNLLHLIPTSHYHLRLIYFTDTFYPTTNGIVTSIVSFARELADRGHRVCIVVPANTGVSDFSYPGIEIIPIKGFPALFYPDFKIAFAFTPSLIRHIRKFKPDIIHYHTQFILGWQAIVLGKLMKIPRIGTFHTYIADEWYLKVIGLDNFRIFGELGWKYNNFFYEHCEHVISPSQNALVELASHGIPDSKISLLPNPLPTEVKTKPIHIEGIPDTPHIICSVGRLSREKSYDVCIRTIHAIAEKIPNVCFVIVGDGPERESLQELTRELGIEKSVLFLGKICHVDLLNSDLFARSKLFLTASTTETQGITIIEAMSFGIPIVGVDEKWVGEIIEDNGYKAPAWDTAALANHCVSLLENTELQTKLWARSLEIVHKYDVAKLTDTLESIYLTAIKNGPRKKS